MNSNRKIYWILSLLAIGSYVWIGYHFSSMHADGHGVGTLCLFKSVTGIPCPSCGVTRAVLLLLQGEVFQSIFMNPLGILALAFLIIIPLWILSDFIQGKFSLLSVYQKSEELIRTQKLIYIPLIAFIAVNWIWNISKGI